MSESIRYTKSWVCKNCVTVTLARATEDRKLLAIKYKDFMAYIKGATGAAVEIICRKCGTPNVVIFEKDNFNEGD